MLEDTNSLDGAQMLETNIVHKDMNVLNFAELELDETVLFCFVLFVLGFYGPVNNEVMSSRSVNSGTVPGQA